MRYKTARISNLQPESEVDKSVFRNQQLKQRRCLGDDNYMELPLWQSYTCILLVAPLPFSSRLSLLPHKCSPLTPDPWPASLPPTLLLPSPPLTLLLTSPPTLLLTSPPPTLLLTSLPPTLLLTSLPLLIEGGNPPQSTRWLPQGPQIQVWSYGRGRLGRVSELAHTFMTKKEPRSSQEVSLGPQMLARSFCHWAAGALVLDQRVLMYSIQLSVVYNSVLRLDHLLTFTHHAKQ